MRLHPVIYREVLSRAGALVQTPLAVCTTSWQLDRPEVPVSRFALLILAPLAACAPDYTVNKGGNGGQGGADDNGSDDGDDDGEDVLDPEDFDGATLNILTPHAGDFLPLGEDTDFTAELLDADGNAMEYAEITWTSDVDAVWGEEALAFTNDSLDVGTHTLTARAVLPNGAVVQDRAGAILVQHEDAGTYVGNMILDLTGEYQGAPITASCVGAAILVVDAWGDAAVGSSDCVLALLGFAQEATLEFDLANDDGALLGESAIDLSFIQYGMEADGDVGDGELTATWADNIYGFLDVTGEMSLERITRDAGE
jgi:hypothetical protein